MMNKKKKRSGAGLLLAAAVALAYSHVVHAANPFSKNVVALTPKNWKKEVVESPHAVFVNVCRIG